VTTPIEHKAVLAAVHQAAREGAEERILDVSATGLVDDASFDRLVRDDVAVCSVMWVNNETGVVQSIPELAARAKSHGVVFHTDAVQALGKFDVQIADLHVDTLTISGHKIGAPKGIGAIFIRRGTPLEPMFHGGSQDRGRRPGTENVAYAVGLATACELTIAEREVEHERLGTLRDRLEALLLDRVPDLVVHSRGAPRAPHVLSVSVPGVDGEALLMALDLRGIAASGGSACQSGNASPSHVLTAMGVATDLASSAVRMSLGCLTTADQIERVATLFPTLVEKARAQATAPSW
jgi:cysteine desulfurase